MVRRGRGRLMRPLHPWRQSVGAGLKPALIAGNAASAVALLTLVGLLVLLAVACAGARQPPAAMPPPLTQPPPATSADPAPAPVATAPDTATVTVIPAQPLPAAATVPAELYDPNRTMYRIWHGLGHSQETTLSALADAERHDDQSQVVVILEALKFFHLDAARGAVETLTALTGQTFEFDRRRWREWIGPRMDEYAPPSDYPRWKVDSLAAIDPAIGAILEPGITRSRVDLTEVVWGGVALDGIPPLEQPPHIRPEPASWLRPDNRVFGVSINGEHRVYPLRVMNAHELANDVLGGEPISLVY